MRMHRECCGTFSPPPRDSDRDMHHGTCVTHVPRCIPRSLTSGFIWSRWRRKRSRYSRRMRNPQFYLSGNRPLMRSQQYTLVILSSFWYRCITDVLVSVWMNRCILDHANYWMLTRSDEFVISYISIILMEPYASVWYVVTNHKCVRICECVRYICIHMTRCYGLCLGETLLGKGSFLGSISDLHVAGSLLWSGLDMLCDTYVNK